MHKLNECVRTLHPPSAFSEPTLKVQSYNLLDSYICSKSVLKWPDRCISFLPAACWKSMAESKREAFPYREVLFRSENKTACTISRGASVRSSTIPCGCQNERIQRIDRLLKWAWLLNDVISAGEECEKEGRIIHFIGIREEEWGVRELPVPRESKARGERKAKEQNANSL